MATSKTPTLRTDWPQIWPAIPNLNVDNTDGDAITGATPLPVIRVYGFPGVGKTSFGMNIIPKPAGSADIPQEVFDWERGSVTFKDQYAMIHHDMTAFDSPEDQWAAFVQKIQAIVPNSRPVVIIDPAEDMEDAAYAWLMANPRHYGRSPRQYTNNYGQATPLFWADLKRLIKGMLLFLSGKGVQTTILVNHVRSKYAGNAPVPNEFEPKGKDILRKLSTLEAWLIGDGFSAPTGIIMRSRLNVLDWEAQESELDEPERRALLPRVVKPFTPGTIRDYIANPRKEFTAAEMENIDPSRIALSEDARRDLELQIAHEQLALAQKEEAARQAAAKNQLMAEMKREGWYQTADEIRSAAAELAARETPITFDVDPDAFMLAMKAYAQEHYPQRFAETA